MATLATLAEQLTTLTERIDAMQAALTQARVRAELRALLPRLRAMRPGDAPVRFAGKPSYRIHCSRWRGWRARQYDVSGLGTYADPLDVLTGIYHDVTGDWDLFPDWER